jgi:hypothetical protein
MQDITNLDKAVFELSVVLEKFRPWIAGLGNARRSQVEAYRKIEKERLEAKAKEKFLATVNENHSQVNADAIADQLAKLISPSPKPRRKPFWEL